MNQDALNTLIAEAIAMQIEDAKEVGALGYMARALVQATMPHRNTDETRHVRQNGDYRLVMVALDSEIGLPFGVIPRLILAWLATQVVVTKSREIIIDESMSSFMRQLGMRATGGRWGTITRLRDQSTRLFNAAIRCSYMTPAGKFENIAAKNLTIADTHHLWWDPRAPEQQSLFESSVTVSERLYREIIEHPVPIDMRALKALRKSPLAIDIYGWLTYRASYLMRPTKISWEGLQAQFGSGYQVNDQGKRDFKKAFLEQLGKVQLVYPAIDAKSDAAGLILARSESHIPRQISD